MSGVAHYSRVACKIKPRAWSASKLQTVENMLVLSLICVCWYVLGLQIYNSAQVQRSSELCFFIREVLNASGLPSF